jgi:hypothetical protein
MSAHAARILVFGLVHTHFMAHYALTCSTCTQVRGILRFGGLDVCVVKAHSGRWRLVEMITHSIMVAATIN